MHRWQKIVSTNDLYGLDRHDQAIWPDINIPARR
jgi:hypothetical protein